MPAKGGGTIGIQNGAENTNPVVSVIMPAYNAAKTIEASIRSVLAQTFTDFELLIIDDCSADDTFGIAEKLTAAEPRAKRAGSRVLRGTRAQKTRTRAEDMQIGHDEERRGNL